MSLFSLSWKIHKAIPWDHCEETEKCWIDLLVPGPAELSYVTMASAGLYENLWNESSEWPKQICSQIQADLANVSLTFSSYEHRKRIKYKAVHLPQITIRNCCLPVSLLHHLHYQKLEHSIKSMESIQNRKENKQIRNGEMHAFCSLLGVANSFLFHKCCLIFLANT